MDLSLDSGGSSRIAVLIDADNTSHKYVEGILDELAKYGTTTIKRAYGDFSSPRLGGWTEQLNRWAIRAMQQHAFTSGKNSTDSALIIDAMDLLYAGNVETFAIVSSDSDFTGLAVRLREAGRRVLGIGRRNTPMSLQNACDKFITVDVLDAGASDVGADVVADSSDSDSPLNLQSALTKAANATAREDGWSTLAALGQHLARSHASFDPRTFGHSKLSALVSDQPYLESKREQNHLILRPKPPRARPAAKTAATKKAAAKKA